jgi:hypothetical protein
LALSGVRFGPVVAQELATPTVACVSPVGDGAPQVATPEASPVAEAEAPVGTAADEATAAAAAAAAGNLIACWNAGNIGAVLDLVTANFILNALGYADRTEAANELTGLLAADALPNITIVEAPHDAMVYDDGRVSVDLGILFGPYQHVDVRWFLLQSGSDLLVDEEVFLSPDPDVDFVTIIGYLIGSAEGATLTLAGSGTITATDAVFIHVDNASATDRTITVVQLAEGTTLNEDGTLPEGALDTAVPIGTVDVAAGGVADMALVGLPTGVYAVVDESDGTTLPLTVTEPAE